MFESPGSPSDEEEACCPADQAWRVERRREAELAAAAEREGEGGREGGGRERDYQQWILETINNSYIFL